MKTNRQLLMEYHTRGAQDAQQVLHESRDFIQRHAALARLQWHTAQVRQLDREAEAEDRAVGQDTFLVRT